jgi:hypothetical protein
VVIMTATLLLTRPFRAADLGRAYQIVLDGMLAGELRESSSVTLPVGPGTHTLQVRLLTLFGKRPGRRSPVVTFEVADGHVAEFACDPPKYPRTSWWWLVCVLGDPERWLQLHQVRS